MTVKLRVQAIVQVLAKDFAKINVKVKADLPLINLRKKLLVIAPAAPVNV
jgi:hypothetical protein